MISLNKLVTAIQTFATNHLQLKSFYFDEIKHYAETESVRYPAMNAFLEGGSTDQGSRSLKIKFYVMDKVRENKSNQTQVLSDTELIILDLLAWFKQTRFTDTLGVQEFLKIEYENTHENFTQSFDDNCSGWFIEIKFTSIFEWDYCPVPLAT